jgi:hypothetical protein
VQRLLLLVGLGRLPVLFEDLRTEVKVNIFFSGQFAEHIM